MNASAQIPSGALVTFTLKSGGKPVPGTFEIYSLRIEQGINRISTATLVVLDGSASDEDFTVSSSAVFVPGAEISIEAGYDSDNTLIFSGIVTRQSLRVDAEVGSALEVECRDKAVKLTIGRKNAAYSNITDSDMIAKLIGAVGGLSADVTATSTQIPELVQYYCSDWDFILARAEVNGLLVTAMNGKVAVFPHDRNTSPVLTVCYGKDMYELHADLNAVTQLGDVKASAWDYKNQKLVSAQSQPTVAGPGNLSTKTLSGVIGLAEYELQTTAAVDSDDLTNWAKAQVLKSEYSKITGTVSCQGSPKVKPGLYITLDGVGARFNGDHLVAGVTHQIEAGNWVSEIAFGLVPAWAVQEPDVVAPTAAGLLPGVQGLYNGTVKKSYDDSDGEYRILVDLPLLDPSGAGLWARLTNFYANNGTGAFFLPEVGDEVIVGFLNDDPRFPVILGSVYSSKNKPWSEFSPDQKNSHKGIVTKSKLRIVFDDENSVLTLMTPNSNQMVFDDKNKQISIKDQNGNSIVMDSSGITLKSPKQITLNANEKIAMSGTQGITAQASGGDVQVSGMNVKLNADTQLSAQGGAMASVQGGTELTLKAAMVMIN